MPSARSSSAPADTDVDGVSMDLYEQPGHLIRRAQQISQGMFSELVSSDITPIQYGILRMVHERPGIDQVGLARLVAVDTSTAAQTAARLETKGLLQRSPSVADRRQLQLFLTEDGEHLLSDLVDGVHRMRESLLAGLSPKEQTLFMELLRKFVHLNNDQSRAPLQGPSDRTAPPAAKPLRRVVKKQPSTRKSAG
jgi:DNA-binding MarR family transcriptional regulator